MGTATLHDVTWSDRDVIACMHSYFRIGGLKAGETKTVRGKIYVVPNDAKALRKRYERDIPEHVTKPDECC